jgi:MFS family permease
MLGGVRRLLVLVSAIMLVDTMFYAALTPLLPHYADTLGLSKTGAGVLTASFGAGTLAGSLPAGLLAVRLGVKPAVLLGLGLLSASSLAFAFGDSIVLLDLARFCQGFGGACTWTGALAWLVSRAPRERRGEVIGSALAAGIAGALIGPLVGGAAASLGTRPVFGAVAAVGVAIGAVAALAPVGRPEVPQTFAHLVAHARHPSLLVGMWLVALPAILFGLLSVLAPLRLHALGVGAAGISAVFLLSAGAESALSPVVGRLADRRGSRALVRVAAIGSACVTLVPPLVDDRYALGGVVVLAGLAYGVFWIPAMTGLLEGAESVGLDASFAFALMNVAWAAGQGIGSFGGGALGSLAGDLAPYWGAAALCVLTLGAAGLTRPASRAYPEAT